jgi:hypothetical protein
MILVATYTLMRASSFIRIRITDMIVHFLCFAGLANFSFTGLASSFTVPSVEIHVFPVIS